MGSAFFELNIGVSGLLASQKGLAITGNNVTNQNTAGYSRQAVTQRASRPLEYTGTGMIGTGTEVSSVARIRDSYLDMKYWNQNNLYSTYSIKSANMSQVAYLLDESESGLNSMITDMFSSFQELTTNSSDSTYFENVKQSMGSLTEYLNSMGESLQKMQSEVNSEISGKVEEINSIADKIQKLNVQIRKIEGNGVEASALRDERDTLVDSLSSIVNVNVEEKDGIHSVSINGQILVKNDKIHTLEVVQREAQNNPEDALNTYDIRWSTGLNFNEYSNSLSGELKALVEIRDGNGGNNFKGTVENVDNTNRQVTISNVNRFDLPENGEINIGGMKFEYDSFTYDEVAMTVTFNMSAEVADPISMNVGASAEVGKGVNYKGIPYYINKMNEFARTLARAMNEAEYRDGSRIEGFNGSKYGYTQSGETGKYMFSYTDEFGNIADGSVGIDYNKITAMNFSISKDIFENPLNIPISSKENPDESQVDMIKQFCDMSHTEIFKEGELTDYMSAIMSEIAIDVNQSNKFVHMQENLKLYVDNRRKSTSGVENNEEMTNIVKYQSAYKAAARIINVMNEIYDVTINGLMN